MSSNAQLQLEHGWFDEVLPYNTNLVHLPSMYSSAVYVFQNYSLDYGTSEYFPFVMLIDLHFLVLFDELIWLENLSGLSSSNHNHLSKLNPYQPSSDH